VQVALVWSVDSALELVPEVQESGRTRSVSPLPITGLHVAMNRQLFAKCGRSPTRRGEQTLCGRYHICAQPAQHKFAFSDSTRRQDGRLRRMVRMCLLHLVYRGRWPGTSSGPVIFQSLGNRTRRMGFLFETGVASHWLNHLHIAPCFRVLRMDFAVHALSLVTNWVRVWNSGEHCHSFLTSPNTRSYMPDYWEV
jgi:hypothetical protein